MHTTSMSTEKNGLAGYEHADKSAADDQFLAESKVDNNRLMDNAETKLASAFEKARKESE